MRRKDVTATRREPACLLSDMPAKPHHLMDPREELEAQLRNLRDHIHCTERERVFYAAGFNMAILNIDQRAEHVAWNRQGNRETHD